MLVSDLDDLADLDDLDDLPEPESEAEEEEAYPEEDWTSLLPLADLELLEDLPEPDAEAEPVPEPEPEPDEEADPRRRRRRSAISAAATSVSTEAGRTTRLRLCRRSAETPRGCEASRTRRVAVIMVSIGRPTRLLDADPAGRLNRRPAAEEPAAADLILEIVPDRGNEWNGPRQIIQKGGQWQWNCHNSHLSRLFRWALGSWLS